MVPGAIHEPPGGPGLTVVWDMNVCHTWYRIDYGQGQCCQQLWRSAR